MARLTLTELIDAINAVIVENTTGSITATQLNTLLQNLTNNLYLPTVATITVNGTGDVSGLVFEGGTSVNIVEGVATITTPDAYRGDFYGDMSITTNEANTVPIGAGQTTTDDTLLPITVGTTYFEIPGYSANISKGVAYDPTNGGLRVTASGDYQASGWASVRHSANSSTVGVVFGIKRGGTIIGVSPRPTPARIPNGGELGLISGEGLVALQADDVLVPLIGSDTAGTITINNSTLVLRMLGNA
jgi:hypothetical protein